VEEFRFWTRRYCPFLLPGTVGQRFCRLPTGQVRSLSPRDLREFCEGRYHECPGYRFWSGASSRLPEVRQRRPA